MTRLLFLLALFVAVAASAQQNLVTGAGRSLAQVLESRFVETLYRNLEQAR